MWGTFAVEKIMQNYLLMYCREGVSQQASLTEGKDHAWLIAFLLYLVSIYKATKLPPVEDR